MLGQGGHGEERQREHGQGDPPVPGGPGADLVLVKAGQALTGLKILLHGPPAAAALTRTAVWPGGRGAWFGTFGPGAGGPGWRSMRGWMMPGARAGRVSSPGWTAASHCGC